jgi:hypothetical protein
MKVTLVKKWVLPFKCLVYDNTRYFLFWHLLYIHVFCSFHKVWKFCIITWLHGHFHYIQSCVKKYSNQCYIFCVSLLWFSKKHPILIHIMLPQNMGKMQTWCVISGRQVEISLLNFFATLLCLSQFRSSNVFPFWNCKIDNFAPITVNVHVC